MGNTKKKISVSISNHNIAKINRITKENPKETTSSVIDSCCDFRLEEVESLLKNPLDLQKRKLELQLEDIERMRKEKRGRKTKSKI